MSGAPRTIMVRIAMAASASLVSVLVSKAKGRRVWSMTQIPSPSGAGKMVR